MKWMNFFRNAVFFSMLLLIFLVTLSFVHSISKFTIQETEKINLFPNASDPDSDRLTINYTFPLDEKGEWQTKYGDAGEYKTRVLVSDGYTETAQDTLIVVRKKEEPPKIDSFSPETEILSIKEGQSAKFEISASDLNKDELTYEWRLDGIKVQDGMDFEYNSTYSDSGIHKISAEVFDGTSIARKEWTLKVTNVERKIIFEKIGSKVVNENEELRIILNAYDPDGGNITYPSQNLPEGAKIENNIFIWKPGYQTVKKEGFFESIKSRFVALSRSFNIFFTASSDGKTESQSVTIIVKDVNGPPVIEDLADIVIKEGDTLKIVPKAYDLDGNKISLSYSGFTNRDTYKSGYDDAGEYYVKVTATDGILETSKFVKVIIEQNNRAPIFDKTGAINAKEGDDLALLLNAHDPDGDEVTYSIDNPPDGAYVKGNTLLWSIPYTLINTQTSKKFDIVLVANDGKAQARQILSAQVTNKNRPPKIIDSSKGITAKVNSPALMFIKAIDEDGDELTYKWNFGLFDSYEATASHQRIFTRRGIKTVKVTVSDGIDSVEEVINVNVV